MSGSRSRCHGRAVAGVHAPPPRVAERPALRDAHGPSRQSR
jgi:hypothetical protein